jgi:ABC-2 type transport system ATP-binding protein
MGFILYTEGLTKEYGELRAVDSLSIHVPEQSVYGFLGPNGSGKTTTIRTMLGLLAPTSGTVFVRGNRVTSREEIVDLVGYAPASPPLYDHLSAREFLEYTTAFRGMDREVADERINELLTRFSLQDAADGRIRTYSTGMKQKLNLLQAIVHEPDVLVLDEPTAGLDPNTVRTFKQFIREYATTNTVFLSSHVLPLVEDVADTVGILRQGTLQFEGSTSELEGEESLESAFSELTT